MSELDKFCQDNDQIDKLYNLVIVYNGIMLANRWYHVNISKINSVMFNSDFLELIVWV